MGELFVVITCMSQAHSLQSALFGRFLIHCPMAAPPTALP